MGIQNCGRLGALWQRVAPLVGPTEVRLIRLHGRARFTGTPLTALYAGNGRNRAYLRDLFMVDAVEEPLAQLSTPWRLMERVQDLVDGVDVCLSELPPAWRFRSPGAHGVRCPAWVRQDVIFTGEPGARWLMPRSAEREAQRQIRRHDYRVEFTTAPGELRAFHQRLYRIYVQERFGEAAVILPEDRFVAACRGQTLAKLYAGDTWVAGMVLLRQGRRLRLGWFGAAATPPPPGASEALDLLVLRHARENGFERVLMGNARPCLADGVLRYKLRLGARLLPCRFPQQGLHIALPGTSPAALECLRRQPLLNPTDEGMGVYRVADEGADAPAIRLEALDGRV